LFVSAVAILSARLREQGVEHFADHALTGAREFVAFPFGDRSDKQSFLAE